MDKSTVRSIKKFDVTETPGAKFPQIRSIINNLPRKRGKHKNRETTIYFFKPKNRVKNDWNRKPQKTQKPKNRNKKS